MQRAVLKAKIHRATVTRANIDHVGSGSSVVHVDERNAVRSSDPEPAGAVQRSIGVRVT